MEYKTIPVLGTKIVDEAQGIVEHIIAVHGVLDLGCDISHPGSFAKTITERGLKALVLDMHKTDSVMRVLGKPVELREVSRGELPRQVLDEYPEATGGVKATTQFLLETPEGKGAFVRLQKDALREWSYGYDALDTDFSTVETKEGEEVTARNLRTLKLYEYGPVLWGMNPATSTLSAKSDDADPAGSGKQMTTAPALVPAETAFVCECVKCGERLQVDEDGCKDAECPSCGGEMRWAAGEEPGKAEGEPSEAKPAPEVTENTIRIRVRDPADFQDESFRTITIGGEGDGIQAVVGRPKGETTTRVQSYVFDKEKWTVARAQAWVDEHKKGAPPEMEHKAVSGGTGFPLAPRERAWDNAAAERRVRAWAGAEDGPNAKYRSAHFWYDAENAENFTAYKLLFVDVIDGEVRAVPKALFAVAGALRGARTPLKISEADQAAIRRKVSAWYAKMRAKFDDDAIVPPWEKSDEPDAEQKAGRVIAARNERRIINAMTALIEVLEDAGIDLPGWEKQPKMPDEEGEGKSAPAPDGRAATDKDQQETNDGQAGPDGGPPTSASDTLATQIQLLELELELMEV